MTDSTEPSRTEIPEIPEQLRDALAGVALTCAGTVHVEVDPEHLYDLVTDIGRTGEWSPICRSCTWEDETDAGPRVGAWFVGHNEHEGRSWDTRSQVVAADPGRAFAWQVGGTFVRWGYELAPAASGSGTDLTETWEFLPEGLEMFVGAYGDDAAHEITVRSGLAHAGIPETLAAIKRVAETAG